ncbi:MAG: methyltransferase domain-containing protein [Euryarchaeota archaeon]|nr:methyltransferase domain-containing protein [Euryarchaeota archaeon]
MDNRYDDAIDTVLAEDFKRYMQRYKKIYQRLAKKVAMNLSTSSEKPVIVDLGTGPGLLLKELHDQIPTAQIIGVDSSENMLMIAHKNINDLHCSDCFVTHARAEQLPFGDNSIDCIVSRLSLSSWEKPQQTFVEIFRVLKPGGRVLIEDLNRGFPAWKLSIRKVLMSLKTAKKDVITYHSEYYARAFSLAEAEQAFIKIGFTIVKKEGKKTGWNFLVIAEKPLTACKILQVL